MAISDTPHPEVGVPESWLTIEVREVGSCALLLLAGELDVSTIGELYELLAGFAQKDICHISLDVENVEFLDSTGLAVLALERQRVESLGGELVILSPSSKLRHLLEIKGLEDFFDIRPKQSLEHRAGVSSTERTDIALPMVEFLERLRALG